MFQATLPYWYTCSARLQLAASGAHNCCILRGGTKKCTIPYKTLRKLLQYGLWSFQMGYTRLEKILHKNQHTQSKLLNFENWTNGEPQQLAKIRLCKVDYFILPLFLMPKLRSVAQNEWKKHPYIFFLLSVQK